MTTIAFVLNLISCTKTIPADLQGKWILQSINETPSANLTLSIEKNGEFHGSLGCNSMSGTMSIQENKMQLGRLLSSAKGCDTDVMQKETQYSQSLSQVQNWSRKDDTLTLSGAKHKLVYTKQTK